MFDSTDASSLEESINKWYPIIKETLDPEHSKLMFVGNKIDLLGIDLNPKTYKPSEPKLENMDKKIQELIHQEKAKGLEDWIDWTYTSAKSKQKVQDTVKRIVKHFTI